MQPNDSQLALLKPARDLDLPLASRRISSALLNPPPTTSLLQLQPPLQTPTPPTSSSKLAPTTTASSSSPFSLPFLRFPSLFYKRKQDRATVEEPTAIDSLRVSRSSPLSLTLVLHSRSHHCNSASPPYPSLPAAEEKEEKEEEKGAAVHPPSLLPRYSPPDPRGRK